MMTNAERQRAYRARKKAEKQQTTNQVADIEASPVTSEDDDLELKVEFAPGVEFTKPAASLKDRLFSIVKPKEPVPGEKKAAPRRRGAKEPNMLVTVLPSVLGSFIATYAQNALPDPYKPCAPSQEESAAIFAPIFAVIGRSIEVTGKVSQTTIDLMNALTCTILYGTRALMTYMQIKKDQEIHATNLRSDQGQNFGTAGYYSGGLALGKNEPPAARDDQWRGTADESESREATEREAIVIRGLFERDRAGRVGLGLLPRTV